MSLHDRVETCKILLDAVAAEVNECGSLDEAKMRIEGFKRIIALC